MPVTTDDVLEVLAVQYGTATGFVTTEEAEAATATYFTPDACVVASFTRSPRGKWMLGSSDYARRTVALDRRRWDSPVAGLHGVARHMGYGQIRTVEL